MTTTEALHSWGSFDLDNPFPLFAAVRDLGPVHPVTLADGHDAWLVVRYEEARAALNDRRLSKDMHAALALGESVVAEGLPGPEFARHMLSVDPPDHSRLRRIVSTAFSPRRVEALRPRVQAITDDLLDDVADRDPASAVDLVSSLAFPLPFTVICELLGVPPADRERLGREFTSLLVPTSTPEEHVEAKKASDAVVAMLHALVAAKQAAPSDDLVSALLAARDGDERLTGQELLSTIFQLMVAGHDTTASLIGNSLVALFRSPAQLAELRNHPGRLPAALEELLRYDAPVPHSTFRYAIEPVTLGGVTIPAGAQVIVSLASANRDGRKFANPESLDIDRGPVRHLAFGHGIHHCLGASLARIEGAVALGSLLERFPDLTLAVQLDQLHWKHGDGLVLRGLSELPVIPGPSRPRAHAGNASPGETAVTVETPAGFLGTPPHSEAAQRLFDDDLRGIGYVSNVSRLWAHLPEALNGLSDLMGVVTRAGSLTLGQRNVLATAAASELGDSYCSMAWGAKLAKAMSPHVAADVIRGSTEGLDGDGQALATWARLLATDPNAITARDVQALRTAGFVDAQIFAITVYVALRLAFSTVNDALGAAPDLELISSTPEPVRSAIVFGRSAGHKPEGTRDIQEEKDACGPRAAGLEPGADE